MFFVWCFSGAFVGASFLVLLFVSLLCFCGAVVDEFLFLLSFLVREFGSLFFFLCSLMSIHSQPGRTFDKSAGQSAVVWCYFWCVSLGVCVFVVLFWCFSLVLMVTHNGFPTVSRRSGAPTNY